MAGAGQQQILKPAQCVGPDHVHHVMAHKRAHCVFAIKNIQVVKPEFGHACQQWIFNRRITARRQTPGVYRLRHFAAEVQGVARFIASFIRHDQFADSRSFDIFTCFALSLKIFYRGLKALVKSGSVRSNGRGAQAGRVSRFNLADSPCFWVWCSGAYSGWRWAVTQTRSYTPYLGRIISLCIGLCAN